MTVVPTWENFDWFEEHRPRASWAAVAELEQLLRDAAAAQCADFEALRTYWDAQLEPLGGDSCHHEWTTFRPLRWRREETWSDWLAHFIETSSSGAFSAAMFGRGQTKTSRVQREESLEGRRADLVIEWVDGSATHVEVKVGDQNFAKTVETAALLERKYANKSAWTHFLLLPSEDLATWDNCPAQAGPPMVAITWDDVAVAVRRGLRSPSESLRWRVWAYGFGGVIEQALLGVPRADTSPTSVGQIAGRLRQIAVMRKGRNDG